MSEDEISAAAAADSRCAPHDAGAIGDGEAYSPDQDFAPCAWPDPGRICDALSHSARNAQGLGTGAHGTRSTGARLSESHRRRSRGRVAEPCFRPSLSGFFTYGGRKRVSAALDGRNSGDELVIAEWDRATGSMWDGSTRRRKRGGASSGTNRRVTLPGATA